MYPQVYVQLIFLTVSYLLLYALPHYRMYFFPPVLKQLPAGEQKCNFII